MVYNYKVGDSLRLVPRHVQDGKNSPISRFWECRRDCGVSLSGGVLVDYVTITAMQIISGVDRPRIVHRRHISCKPASGCWLSGSRLKSANDKVNIQAVWGTLQVSPVLPVLGLSEPWSSLGRKYLMIIGTVSLYHWLLTQYHWLLTLYLCIIDYWHCIIEHWHCTTVSWSIRTVSLSIDSVSLYHWLLTLSLYHWLLTLYHCLLILYHCIIEYWPCITVSLTTDTVSLITDTVSLIIDTVSL